MTTKVIIIVDKVNVGPQESVITIGTKQWRAKGPVRIEDYLTATQQVTVREATEADSDIAYLPESSNTDMALEGLFSAVVTESIYQEQRWGHENDDTKNSPNDWASYIAHYATKWFPGGFAPYKADTVDAFRKSMIKVATLAISAIRSLNRQQLAKGKPFYQE